MAEFGLSFSGIYFCISSSNFIATIISIDDLIVRYPQLAVCREDLQAAVETIFGVEVEKVHTLNFKGKTTRRTRYGAGRHSDWKKAYVKLAKGALDWDNLQASEEKPAAPEESKE